MTVSFGLHGVEPGCAVVPGAPRVHVDRVRSSRFTACLAAIAFGKDHVAIELVRLFQGSSLGFDGADSHVVISTSYSTVLGYITSSLVFVEEAIGI